MKNAEIVPVPQGELLECPTWHPGQKALYFCDITAKALCRYFPDTGAYEAYQMPAQIGSFALCRDGRVLVALQNGIHIFDIARGTFDLACPPDYDQSVFRFNDGRCDRSGRFYVGTMYLPRDKPQAALYAYSGGASAKRIVEGITLANGLAFSPDNQTAFFADTIANTVWCFDHDVPSGHFSNRRVFTVFKPGQGRPDGATIDAEGCYWIAMIDAGRIGRFSPSGELLMEIEVPSRWPTMPAFGGPDMKTLYVTSLRINRPPEQLAHDPHAGKLFQIEVDVPGIPETFFTV